MGVSVPSAGLGAFDTSVVGSWIEVGQNEGEDARSRSMRTPCTVKATAERAA